MGKFVPDPSILDDICVAGIKNQKLATSAIGELLEQIYELDVPILSCVDGFNWFYRPSCHSSFGYHNDRGLDGRVPPNHIAISRLFMNLDGHRIKKGLKVVASSNYPLYKHTFEISKILLPRSKHAQTQTTSTRSGPWTRRSAGTHPSTASGRAGGLRLPWCARTWTTCS